MTSSEKDKSILTPRPKDINKILRKSVSLLAGELDEFRYANFSRILFIYKPDLTASRAKILPLKFNDTCLSISGDGKRVRPSVRIDGRRILYIVEYGDAFLKSTQEKKLRTIIHELLHCSPFFNGTLSRSHRHENLGASRYAKVVDNIAFSISKPVNNRLLELLELNGIIEIQTWRSPFSLSKFSRRSEKDILRIIISND